MQTIRHNYDTSLQLLQSPVILHRHATKANCQPLCQQRQELIYDAVYMSTYNKLRDLRPKRQQV